MPSSTYHGKTEIIAVASGKGGTGKTLMTACMGYVLTRSALRVLMIDADAGTDGLSLFLLGPKGWTQLGNFDKHNTYAGLLDTYAGGDAPEIAPRTIYRNVDENDDQIQYEVLISGRGIYGDPALLHTSPVPQRSNFRSSVATLFETLRAQDLYDYILVDTRGGFAFESTDVCALADSFIVVTEANVTNLYQDRNLVRRINAVAKELDRKPVLRGIFVNKATDGDEVSFRNILTREFPLRFEETYAVPLNMDALKAYREQRIPYAVAAASAFSYATLSAFSDLFQVVTSRWDPDHVTRWNTIIQEVSDKIAANNARLKKEEARDRRISQLMFAALYGLATLLIVGVVSFYLYYENRQARDDLRAQLYTADVSSAVKVTNLQALYDQNEIQFDYVGLAEADLQGLHLAGVTMRRANLENARLNDADLSGADLARANLKGTQLTGADLRGANLFATHFDHLNQFANVLTDSTTILPDSSRGPFNPTREDRDPTAVIGVENNAQRNRGYIWIGNYDQASGSWSRSFLTRLDGRPVAEPPRDLAPGSLFIVGGNMTLREALPKNNAAYFREQRSLGVVLRGTTVTLLDAPVGIDRDYAVQYWALFEASRGIGDTPVQDPATQ